MSSKLRDEVSSKHEDETSVETFTSQQLLFFLSLAFDGISSSVQAGFDGISSSPNALLFDVFVEQV